MKIVSFSCEKNVFQLLFPRRTLNVGLWYLQQVSRNVTPPPAGGTGTLSLRELAARSRRRTTFYHVMRHHFFSRLPFVRLHHVRSLRYYEQCRDEHKTYIFRIMSEEGLTGSDSADGVKAFNKLHQVTSRTA